MAEEIAENGIFTTEALREMRLAQREVEHIYRRLLAKLYKHWFVLLGTSGGKEYWLFGRTSG